MPVIQAIKENPLKVFFGSSGTIITLVGALFTLDARYAHAADVEKDKVQTQKIIQDTTSNLRKSMLEDKIFELDLKRSQERTQQLSPVDKAMKDRYERQLKDINRSQRSE